MRRQVALAMACSFAGLACGAISGCGGGDEFDVVPISGTVTCNGDPLSAGHVQFMPSSGAASEGGGSTIAGKMATAVIQADGSYTLTTYEEGDGAVVGRLRVLILPATTDDEDVENYQDDDEENEEDDEDNDDEEIPLPCPMPRDLFVEVTAGTSVVNIEMADGGSVTTQ